MFTETGDRQLAKTKYLIVFNPNRVEKLTLQPQERLLLIQVFASENNTWAPIYPRRKSSKIEEP